MFAKNIVERIADAAPVARLGQLDEEGHPQALPFVFARTGDALWSPVDGKPKKHARLSRLAWIAKHPEVCVLVDHYADDWSRLWWLKLYCHAEVFRGSHPEWEQAITKLGQKYDQYAATAMFSGDPTMIRFEWREWKSWSAGGDAAVLAWLKSETRAQR